MQIIIGRSKQFSVPTFCCSSGNPGVKVPVVDDALSSHEQDIYPATSFDENSIEFEFQTDRNVYVELRRTYLALKVKLVKGRGFEIYKTTEKKKEHKEDTVFTETSDNGVEFIEEDEGVPHITHVNNILHSIFAHAEVYINNHQIYNSNGLYAHKEVAKGVPHITHVNNILHSIFAHAEVYINNHQICNSNGLYAHKPHVSNNFKSALSDYKAVLHCERNDYEQDPGNLLESPFFTRRRKLYSRPDGFMLYGKLGIDFLTTSELL